MSASQRFNRPVFLRASFMLLFVLAWIWLGQDTALGQRRIVSPVQPPQSHILNLRFSGEQPRPLAMVSGDFDEDGVADLVIGYGLEKGGSIALLRGNLDAIAPQTEESWLAAGRHEYSDPFLRPSRVRPVSTAPSMMISADVNGDGHLDLVYASQGSSLLQVMIGTGKGTFLPQPLSIRLPGNITALASYRPGAPLPGEALIVGYESKLGAKLGILSYSATGLSIKAAYPLPSAATALTVASLDDDFIPDTAIVADGELLVLHGANAINGGGHLDVLPVDGVESVASGEFLFDRHAQLQLSVVNANGEVNILAHQGFDSRRYTPEQIATARREQMLHPGSPSLAQQAGNTGNQPWTVVESHPDLVRHGSGFRGPILLRSRMSGSGADDLVVLNPSQQQRVVIGHQAGASPASASRLTQSGPSHIAVSSLGSDNLVAALSMRVSADGRPGLVVLHEGDPSPEITVPSAGNIFYVNTTADNTGTTTDPPSATRCTQGQPTSNPCTLRDAITYVNDDAGDNISGGDSDTIMVPAGTYTLSWQAGTFDANGNALTHLEVLGPVTIIGSTSGNGVIINANKNDTIFTINPGPFGSFNPSGNSYVFDMTIENVTMENAQNNNNINTNSSGLTNNVGGGLNWDANGTGNLTLMNSTVQNCTIFWGAGGGIWAENSAGGGSGKLTLTGGSVSNNGTPEQGGGVYIAFPAVAMTATNTTISNNTAEPSVNPSDPGAEGSAGGLFLTERTGSPATPQTTLTGVTIKGNVTTVDGGGIYTNTGIMLSTSLVQNNSAGRWGGGIFAEEADPEIQSTVTSTNILSNSATTTGGGIAVGPDNPTGSQSLQVTLSRIFGNTSSGTTGLGTVSPGKAVATNNWWGCNAGPTNASCDKAGSGATVSPWATFGLGATPTAVNIGNNIDLTITLNKDSNNGAISGAFPAVATNYPYSLSVSGVTGTLPSSSTFDTTGTGTATLTPTSTGSGKVSATFDNQTDSVNFTVNQISQTITFGALPNVTYGVAPITLTATASSGLTVTYTVTGPAMVSGSLLTITGAGGVTVTANQAGDTTYAAAPPVMQSFTVNPATPTLAFSVPNQILGTPPFAVNATSNSPGAITYSVVSGPATISGNTVTLTGPGPVTLQASQAATTNFTSGSIQASFEVLGKSQTTIASLTATAATIDVFGFGFTAPSGQLAFTDVTSGNPVTAPVTLNTSTATTALTTQVTTSTGTNTLPCWTELADVNGDGILDLITSLYNTDSVTVQLGNGDGTFQAATSYLIASGFGPAEVHAASLGAANGRRWI